MNAVVLLRAVFDESAMGGVYAGPHVLDGSSEVAIGLARQWRATARDGRVIGVAIGPAEWEPALRVALMLGCDEVRRGWSERMAEADVLTVARAISSSLPAETAIVIGGESSSDHGTGVLPAAVAENLAWPYLGDVTAIVCGEPATTLSVRRDGGRRLHCWTAGPVVVAAARVPSPAFYPRVARCIAAKKAGIACLDLGDTAGEQRLEVVGYGPAKPLTRHLLQPSAGANPAQRLRQLMAGGVASRGAQSIGGGTSDDTARKLADLLVSEGFVP